MSLDERTQIAYTENASKYSQDWLQQPEPTDIYQLIQKFFLAKGTVADIGCGNGRDANWLQQNGFQVFGFDSSTDLLRLAHELFPSILFLKAVLPELDEIDSQFDNVFCETVIMHLPSNQVELALQNLKRIIKSNGILYLSWRVTEGADIRHEDGRLYSAFASDFILKHFPDEGILFFNEQLSLSSKKRVCRLLWRKCEERK